MKGTHHHSQAVSVLAVTLAVGLGALASDEVDRYSEWTDPVNVGPPVNSVFAEQGASLSKDGLTLYFICLDCPGGFGGFDIWVSKRPAPDAVWQVPVNLGPAVNSAANENSPALSIDGHRLYFNSDRPNGLGGQDLYLSRRHDKRKDFAWRDAEHLGGVINTAANDTAPIEFEDDDTGVTMLYFTSNRPGGFGGDDIYISVVQPDETFAPAVLVAELSSAANDRQPAVRRDGLELFLASDRPGTFGNLDLWVSKRVSTSQPWSYPENLGAIVNGPNIDAKPSLSFDGTELYFQRPTDPRNVSPFFDLWRTRRAKLRAE